MNHWNDLRARWMLSALGTVVLIALLFCLPVWNVRSISSTVASLAPDAPISTVTVIQRTQPLPVVKNQIVPVPPLQQHAEAIPSPREEVVAYTDELPVDAVNDEAAAANDAGTTNDVPSSASDAKADASYKSYVLGRIASKKTYPYAARSKGLEGKVRVRLVINPDGTVAHADVIESSEYALLNEACLAAIQKAAPFKKMTSGMSAMTISFVMDFSLR
ncbi:MAG: energy transducer TonB [Treponema sp.]|nr:energy transducer TonB [Treponema sp.]